MAEYKVSPELAAELRAQLTSELQNRGYAPHPSDLNGALAAITKLVQDDVNGVAKAEVGKVDAAKAEADRKAAEADKAAKAAAAAGGNRPNPAAPAVAPTASVHPAPTPIK